MKIKIIEGSCKGVLLIAIDNELNSSSRLPKTSKYTQAAEYDIMVRGS